MLAIKESDIINYLDADNTFTIDRECPLYIGDYEFHLEYDIILKRINATFVAQGETKNKSYTARYDISQNRDVPTSTINASRISASSLCRIRPVGLLG